MTTANKYEDFLSSYWSDLHSVAVSKASDGGSSVGIKQSGETPREQAERLRKIIRFLSSMRSSKIIDQSLYLALLLPVEEKYAKVVDHMDKTEGLNNNADAIMGIIPRSANASASWCSSLTTSDSSEQTSLLKEIITKAKVSMNEAAEEKKTLKCIRVVKNAEMNGQTRSHPQCLQLSEPNISKENREKNDFCENGEGKHREVAENHPVKMTLRNDELFFQSKLKTQTMGSLVPRHRSAFVKRSCPFSTEGPNKQTKTTQEGLQNDQQSMQLPLDSNKPFSVPQTNTDYGIYQRKQKTDSIIYNKQRGESTIDIEDEDETKSTNTFMTARDQYNIDQRRKNGPNTSNESRSIKPSDYGQTKKSLGTRRGTSSRFVPPVMNREEYGVTSKRRMAYNGASGNHHTNSEYQDEKLKNIDPKMIEMIENEIMDHGPPITWDDIAGLEFAKNTIQEIVIWPMLRPDIFTGLRGPPKGLLLFGPPGTGKTLIGKCIASQSHATFFSISASSLTSKWIGEGEKMVRALFSVARCQESAVVFIDEIDSLLSQRTDGEHEATRRIKTEFLVQLDGATTKSEERLLVVGATNRPQELDEAARRRLVKRLYIPLPDDDARKQIVYNLVKEQNCSLTDDDYCKIVHNTQGYSGADMANLCREAALGPIRTMTVKDIRYIKSDEVRPMLYKDFEMALRSIRPSVSQKDLESYITWNKLYGCCAV